MAELPRTPRPAGPQQLTKGHLFAMGALAVSMSTLTFFIGLQVGRGATAEPDEPVVVALLDEEARTGDLETLLMRVEAALSAGTGAPISSDGVPSTGWAIQVGVRDDAGEARQVVETLRAAGLEAYHVSALVDGRAEHRVRVGGFSSEASATAALPEIRGRAGTSTASVTRAP